MGPWPPADDSAATEADYRNGGVDDEMGMTDGGDDECEAMVMEVAMRAAEAAATQRAAGRAAEGSPARVGDGVTAGDGCSGVSAVPTGGALTG
eukprot:363347-Chlamydomonas_euryale.AAC.6